MAKYKNGRFPLSLFEHLGGNIYLPPATAARFRGFRQDIFDEVGVWIRITPDRSGLGGWNGYRPYDIQVNYKRVLGRLASAAGFSSHGGRYLLRDFFAFDVDNWAQVPWKVFTRLAKKWGLKTNFVLPTEKWHVGDPNPWTMPNVGGSAAPAKKEIEVIAYRREDKKSRSGGRTIAAGDGFWLHLDANATSSKASNIVGGIGEYSITTHVYAEGAPGDLVDIALYWDDTKSAGPHSPHYTETLVFDRDGQIRASREFKRAVKAGYAVYARLNADAGNKAPVKVTVFDTDAFLFKA